jgi:hypothetical protein
MQFFARLLVSFTVLLILGGCATSRSELDIAAPVPSELQQSNGKTVFINYSADKRNFEEKPRSPSIPSLDPGRAQSEEIKLRALGRKRNTYGKALGDILLKDGVTVETLTAASIAKAFNDRGYRVLNDRSEATADTLIVDSNIDRFWAWMNPGFWALTLNAEIATDMTVKSSEESERIKVAVKASNHFQTATEGNWIHVINEALRLYVDGLKAKIK